MLFIKIQTPPRFKSMGLSAHTNEYPDNCSLWSLLEYDEESKRISDKQCYELWHKLKDNKIISRQAVKVPVTYFKILRKINNRHGV